MLLLDEVGGDDVKKEDEDGKEAEEKDKGT